MTKKEIRFIESQIKNYEFWANQEYERASSEKNQDFKEEILVQARLNESAADTLQHLLDKLYELK